MTEKDRIMNTNIIPIEIEREIRKAIDSLLAFEHIDEYLKELQKSNKCQPI